MLAHHSWAGFDETSTTFEGRVESLKVQNPHALIELRDAGDRHYTIVMGSINALTRQGYTLSRLQELVKPNDTIVVTGRLKKEGGSIEVFPLQIDNKAGGRIFPAR
jgi:hypothetical protein